VKKLKGKRGPEEGKLLLHRRKKKRNGTRAARKKKKESGINPEEWGNIIPRGGRIRPAREISRQGQTETLTGINLIERLLWEKR